MKRKQALLWTTFMLALVLSGCQSQTAIKYNVGKDTLETVGNGMFQVGKFPDHISLEMFFEGSHTKKIDNNVIKSSL